jgi:hypothetical protein
VNLFVPEGKELMLFEIWILFITSQRIYSFSFSMLRHFFFTAMLFVYGRLLSQRLVNTITSDRFLYQLVSSLFKYHMAICYFLYIAGWLYIRLIFVVSHNGNEES